jgi:hypothetical protein
MPNPFRGKSNRQFLTGRQRYSQTIVEQAQAGGYLRSGEPVAIEARRDREGEKGENASALSRSRLAKENYAQMQEAFLAWFKAG